MADKPGRTGLTPAGDVIRGMPLYQEIKVPSPVQQRLIDAATAIRDQPDAVERAFMARQLIICTLPHTDPGDIELWSRRSWNAVLGIQPGFDLETGRKIGFPYGTIPRLLLYWITTEVQHRKNRTDLTIDEKRTLQLGRRLADFMRTVGLSPETGRGKRGDAKRLHDQMERLFRARISFQSSGDGPGRDGTCRRRWLDMEVAPLGELWWNPKRPDQGTLWQSWIQLGEQFYDALAVSSAPVDMRALKALRRSPLALDLYAWVCYSIYTIVQNRLPPQFVAWSVLARQLGADYGTVNDFQKKAAPILRKIRLLYPGLTVGKRKGGFTIHADRLAVPPDSRKLIADG
ncbi:MAG: plasmid encoded RepA protein [Acidobacteria bacterium]|nr:MAG: plasmid encoded RepA protein [Acidobacteriota bacterium]